MRPVASLTSPSRPFIDTDAATHSTAGAREAAGTAAASSSHQATFAPAPARTGASAQPPATSWSSSQSPSSSSRSARSRPVRPESVSLIRRRSRSTSVNCVAVMPPDASRASVSRRRSEVSRSASTARVAAAAGLLSSCARPADNVPRATSASRWRAVASIRRTVLTRPLMKCRPKGNHCSGQPPQLGGRQPQHASGRLGAGGREVGAVLVPRGEPAGPLAGRRHHPHRRVLGADATQRARRSPRAGPTRCRRARPRGTAPPPGRRRARAAASRRSPSWASSRPSKRHQPAELGEVHQIVAR